MPRHPRIDIPGGIHHVWQRGNRRQVVFLDEDDHHTFLRLLRATVRNCRWHLLAYCLMGNHFHLAVETPEANLGRGMRDLCSRYAQLFNERHETGGGHVFQARFGSKLVRNEEQLGQLLRYIARNPVRAGLCVDPADWPWSSHRALLSGRGGPLVHTERVLGLLEAAHGASPNAYAALFEPGGPLRHLPADLSPWKIRPTLDEILETVDLAAALRRAKRHGYRVADVAAHLGVSEVTLWRRAKN